MSSMPESLSVLRAAAGHGRMGSMLVQGAGKHYAGDLPAQLLCYQPIPFLNVSHAAPCLPCPACFVNVCC
jgi:hypothetical protein